MLETSMRAALAKVGLKIEIPLNLRKLRRKIFADIYAKENGKRYFSRITNTHILENIAMLMRQLHIIKHFQLQHILKKKQEKAHGFKDEKQNSVFCFVQILQALKNCYN